MYVKCNIEARSCKHYSRGKAINITYYENVSASLGIQHAVHVRHVIYACPAVQYFFLHYLINGKIFGKGY
jgi:hypothetical protein